MHGSSLAFSVLSRHLDPTSLLYSIYVPHVSLVTHLSLEIGRKQGLSEASLQFIEEAGLLHDIGIIGVDDPEIGCIGSAPYLTHGVIGREILESEGLPLHGLVAERHTGVGITLEEVRKSKLPLPERNYIPESIEEKILCYADLFFTKDPARLWMKKSVAEVRASLEKFGSEKTSIFDTWHATFTQ